MPGMDRLTQCKVKSRCGRTPVRGSGDVIERNIRITSNQEVRHGNRHRSPERYDRLAKSTGRTKNFYMTEALAAEIGRLEYEYGLMNYPGSVWLRGMPVCGA